MNKKYYDRTNNELLIESKLTSKHGWFPVNQTVEVSNGSNNETISETKINASEYFTTDYEIDACAVIFPNHSGIKYGNKKDSYLVKIIKLSEEDLNKERNEDGKYEYFNTTEEIDIKNLLLDISYTSDLIGNKGWNIYKKIPFNLKFKVNTLGVLVSESSLTAETEDDWKSLLELQIYENENKKYTDDEIYEFLNSKYRIIGLRFKEIKSFYKSPLSPEQIAAYKKEREERKKEAENNSIMQGKVATVSDVVKKEKKDILEKHRHIFEEAKKTLEKSTEKFIADTIYEGKIEEFVNSWSKEEKDNINRKPLVQICAMFQNDEIREESLNKLFYFKLDELIFDIHKTNPEWLIQFITRLKAFFQALYIPLIFIPENRIFITNPLNIFKDFKEDSSFEERYNVIVNKLTDENFKCFMYDKSFNLASLRECCEKMEMKPDETYLDLKEYFGESIKSIDKSIMNICINEFSIIFELFGYSISSFNDENLRIYIKRINKK